MSLFLSLSLSLYFCWSVHACLAPSTGSPSLTCTPNWLPPSARQHTRKVANMTLFLHSQTFHSILKVKEVVSKIIKLFNVTVLTFYIVKYLNFMFGISMKVVLDETIKTLKCIKSCWLAKVCFVVSPIYDPLEGKTMSRKSCYFDTETRESLGRPATPQLSTFIFWPSYAHVGQQGLPE